jgi:hypothetical protein
MLAGRMLLSLGAVNAACSLSGWTAQSTGHSGTVSDVLWVDSLLGVLLLITLTLAHRGSRSPFASLTAI